MDSTATNCYDGSTDNYSHHVDAIKMELHYIDYSSATIKEDSMEQVKAMNYHRITIAIVGNHLGNCCKIAVGSHLACCCLGYYLLCAAIAKDCCSSFRCCYRRDGLDCWCLVGLLDITNVGLKTFSNSTFTIYF